MFKELPYTSSIKDMPFMFYEMRRTAILLCEKRTAEDIVEMSLQKNIYQLEKEKRRRDVPLRMLKRLSTISMPLIKVVADGNEEDAKFIAFLSLMKADRLLFEYMREVYADRYHHSQGELADKDFINFIERKAQNNDSVAKWTSTNLVRIKNTYKNVLCEAGLAKRNGNTLLILKPICEPQLRVLLGEANSIYAKAMLLEE
ncbi:hypothetical protein BBD42_03705 [Paenibacillus sp. BIHB 4019]|uniref:DUF1819 domain-containing protein n=1 Tax=Paenibacillus sp. BIHB 4019 TaxID=1870819 RepID=A0A1B2DD90_9BACL|nr:DUF1819 family protein [Paenibacillus sp. BIHB 4019]ANY65665.1 hypothetical protein BBD42_03705 [Paenibacillus sp. BIHB 4019]